MTKLTKKKRKNKRRESEKQPITVKTPQKFPAQSSELLPIGRVPQSVTSNSMYHSHNLPTIQPSKRAQDTAPSICFMGETLCYLWTYWHIRIQALSKSSNKNS